jgi:hypothetical protein
MPNGNTDYGFDMSSFLESYFRHYNQPSAGSLAGNQQDSFSVMRGLFPLSEYPGLTDAELSKFTQFIGEIPQSLYDITDPNAALYQQQREEKTGFLQKRAGQQIGKGFELGQSSVFQTAREARGMAGQTGVVQGRDFMKGVRREASREQQRGSEGIYNIYEEGVYDINEDIVSQIDENRRYLASLEADRRRDILTLARYAEFFGEKYEGTEETRNPSFVPGMGNASFDWTTWGSFYSPGTGDEEEEEVV